MLKKLDSIINNINNNLILPKKETVSFFKNNVKKIAIILSSSRGGSSLLKEVLISSPDVLYTSGEETPFFLLSKNEYPYVESDELYNIKNEHIFLSHMYSDLGKITHFNSVNLDVIIKKIYNRLNIQLVNTNYDLSYDNIKKHVLEQIGKHVTNVGLLKAVISNIAGQNILSLYDTCVDYTNLSFNFDFKIEDTPFVLPKITNEPFFEELQTKTYIMKTPQNAYKIGLFEKIFPNAKIKYIHLSRGFAQSVNGLMDGWLYPRGFFAKNMNLTNETLNISGYSDKTKTGKTWWKFDLPPNWKEYTNLPLTEVCLNQWCSAHEHIFNSNIDNDSILRVKFENFIKNPQLVVNSITSFLNIDKLEKIKLPYVMATDKPAPKRWHKRYNKIMPLAEKPRVQELMSKLMYKMDEETWI